MNKFLKNLKIEVFYQCTDEHTLSELLDKKKLKLISDLTVRPQVYMLEVYFKLCV